MIITLTLYDGRDVLFNTETDEVLAVFPPVKEMIEKRNKEKYRWKEYQRKLKRMEKDLENWKNNLKE